jgi:hypothetical protein
MEWVFRRFYDALCHKKILRVPQTPEEAFSLHLYIVLVLVDALLRTVSLIQMTNVAFE